MRGGRMVRGRGSVQLRHLCLLVGRGEWLEMYGVEPYAAVQLAVVDEGLSHQEAARRFGIDRRAVKKMLSYAAPSGYRWKVSIRQPEI